jgi:hypothetical protein
MTKKILFISNKRSIKHVNNDENCYSTTLASGLSNSINFVVNMLKHENYDCKYIQVKDGNSIDKEVTLEKPTIVIIEAIWVTPEKLAELSELHKNIKWIVRIHSETPFLANEGVAIDWLMRYTKINNRVSISVNSDRIQKELETVAGVPVFYLPNYYPTKNEKLKTKEIGYEINVGCFGAIRPMKNQLIQAIAAIKFAKDIKKGLRFHINVNREETGGNSVLKNIRSLFEHTNATLIEHPWAEHGEFIEILDQIEIGMQASLSETYNIVTADMVNKFIPVVVSKEIRWVKEDFKVNPTSFEDIVNKLHFCYKSINRQVVKKNKDLLTKNSENSIKIWKQFLNKI